MNRLLLLSLFVFGQLHNIVQGQFSFPETKLFNANDGLSQSHINTIMQDSRGFIWVGTENGLSRYDGYEFVNYIHQPYDTNSLSNNYINAICEDSHGVLWIATKKGLNSFDVTKGIFNAYTHDPKKSNSISDDLVLNVYIDSENTIWVKTLKSLDQFDEKTKTFRRYAHYFDLFKFVSGYIHFPIFEDKDGRLWVGTKDGLNFFDRDLQLFNRYISLEYNVKSLSNDEIRSICQDKDGIIWIGTADGLNAFNPTTKEFQRYYPEPNVQNFVNSNRINALYQDDNGTFWVGTGGGLFIFDKETDKFIKVTGKGNQPLNFHISSITKDKSGVLWVGTLKGLLKMNSKKAKFKLYRSGISPGYDFTSDDISTLYTPDNGNIFIGTWGTGLNILNRKTHTVKHFDFGKNGAEEDNLVNCVFEISKDNYLLGTNNGILLFNPTTGQVKNISKAEKYSGFELFLQNPVNTIIRDNKGRIWVGTFHGLYQLSSDLKNIKSYLNNPDNKNSLCDNSVYCLELDRKNNLWIGTENGLDYLDPEIDKFSHYGEQKSDDKLLSSSTIYNLRFDPDGFLWVGTSSGLIRLNTRDRSTRILTVKNGISDNLIDAILIDAQKDIWISTDHGINCIDSKTFKVRTFDVYDGLQDYEFNRNVACQNADGELFFGGISGFNSFMPDKMVDNKFIPPVLLTSVEIITNKGKIEPLNPFQDKIIIPYKTPIFTINFAALDYTLPEKNNFAYKFYSDKEGDWVNIGNRHSATFSNLKPGEYYIKVKGSNSDLVWNEEGLTIVVRIESPFWLKTEAYYLYGFIIIITILGMYRFRTYNLRKANKVLKDREVAAREIELQKEQLAIKNKNITDSINYAKRIQEALMPSEKFFKKILPESFIFHQPKDIVSGDFFWVSERGNKIYVAAVDCTGHGVPGAFMSIIGFELFRKITHSQGVDDPSKILNILNHEFEEVFRDVDNITLKDGMDIAFCVIDKQTRILEFSGAVNPIYLIRDNKITEIRGSRFSVGLDDTYDEEQTFESKQIILQEDDVIYLFSDGYADQFGGPEGKKFKYRRFRHLLLTVHQYPMEEQLRLLEERINRWKGSTEQVDDILVIGFRPVLYEANS
jgi:ligand-binding sensor domain-containing protein/serine phosphatase RsbU (regulator of sigma subunit)